MSRIDVLTLGRVSVDLYPEQIGVPLADVRTFRKMLGGSPTNVAVAAARLGRSAAVFTKVGADGFGDYVRAALERFGVCSSFVGTEPGLRTPLAFCEIFPPDRFPLLFYREPTAPDLQLREEDLANLPVEDAGVLWVTGTGLAEEPSRSTTLAALRRRRRRAHTVFDLDYRPMLWREDAGPWYREAGELATVIVGNAEEWSVLGVPPAGLELAIEKLGRDGARAVRERRSVVVSPISVDVVNGLGAGDAFGGALCHGLLAGWGLEALLRFANAAGALVASRLGCSDDMPTAAEVEALLCVA
ncbi:MAG: 5-dehydro-2-deoxygluconokinase [Gaiellaceae bacterium]